ncbi:hypothetical protein [Haliscomenobacter hydrossis]|uniref:DUF5362 domain-containing protein n=1 Tax=Haliscomenobacter hydrossis (strain ATCC 27775 / DSM 1100 / LMG 10767 / O) TaxID=760192 RepID=F4KVI9_HALH1|nr:hypothetical protein [Haliscomenobacter hydrossis]AEE51302.1 hypothetical protein Halhy_3446 [Haliscomenobacter hydrossis DSM 1100]
MENSEILDEFQPSRNSEKEWVINNQMQESLSNAAQWGNILAIIGFVMLGLGAVVGLAAIVSIAAFGAMGEGIPEMEGMSIMIWVAIGLYIVFLVVYIFPLLYLKRFSTKMKAAMAGDGSQSLADSFENLGKLFKFLGILTLVVIGVYFAFYVLMFANGI